MEALLQNLKWGFGGFKKLNVVAFTTLFFDLLNPEPVEPVLSFGHLFGHWAFIWTLSIYLDIGHLIGVASDNKGLGECPRFNGEDGLDAK